MDERIQKYFQEELGATERLTLLRQIEADEALKKQFIEYKNMQALLALADPVDHRETSEESLHLFQQSIKRNTIRRTLVRMSRYAAVIALFMTVTYWVTKQHFSSESPVIAHNTLYIPAGQRMKIKLQDGTTVWLNSKTTFTYPALFSGKERRVSVDGEAFFEVAKDTEKPFIVSAQGVEMKVLGTTFNVQGYAGEKEVRTSLIEGSLQVYLPESNPEGIILKPHEQVTVTGHSMKVNPITHGDYFLWTDGIYSFDNERLGSILNRLEHYYDVKIMVEDPSISEWRYRGKFRQRDGIDEILRMIQRIHKLKIRKDERNNTITLSL